MSKRILGVVLYGVVCQTAYSMEDEVSIPVGHLMGKVIQQEINHKNHEMEIEHIAEVEETFVARSAMCCRISGNLIDVAGSLAGYTTAALATASVMPLSADTKFGLGIAASIGGIITGFLHNIKPMIEKISKEKEERFKALHLEHQKV